MLFTLVSFTCAKLPSVQPKNERHPYDPVSVTELPRQAGRFLQQMEWHPGSDDVSYEESRAPHILDPQEKHLPVDFFGALHARPDGWESGHPYDEAEDPEEDMFAAQLVRAYARENDATMQGSKPLIREYRRWPPPFVLPC